MSHKDGRMDPSDETATCQDGRAEAGVSEQIEVRNETGIYLRVTARRSKSSGIIYVNVGGEHMEYGQHNLIVPGDHVRILLLEVAE